MREEIRPTKVYVEEYKIIDKLFYVSDNGLKTSDKKKDIELYEAEVKKQLDKKEIFDSIKKIPEVENNNFYRNDTYYFKLKDKDELKWLLKNYYYTDKLNSAQKDFKGGWASIQYDDGGDYSPDVTVIFGAYLYKHIKREYDIYKEILDDIKKDSK